MSRGGLLGGSLSGGSGVEVEVGVVATGLVSRWWRVRRDEGGTGLKGGRCRGGGDGVCKCSRWVRRRSAVLRWRGPGSYGLRWRGKAVSR